MNWIDEHSQTNNCGTIGNREISRLFFADDLVLLSSAKSGLQRALNDFAAVCDNAGMKTSTIKTEVLHLSRNSDQCCRKLSKRELSKKVKISIYKTVFVPVLTYARIES